MSSQVQNVVNAIFQQLFPRFLAKCGFYTFYCKSCLWSHLRLTHSPTPSQSTPPHPNKSSILISPPHPVFAGINVLLALFVWFFIPETRKVALENMDTLFGGQDHVEKGATMLGVDDPMHGHHGMQDGHYHGSVGDVKDGGRVGEAREVEEVREVR
jgi:hypothetical protein